MSAALVTATVHTLHFEFVGVGLTETQAIESLLRGWEAHCVDYPDALPELMQTYVNGEDYSIGTLNPSQCYRDGEGLL